MNTLIKAAEIWLPTPDGSLLEFGGGYYGRANAFGAASRALAFGRGEGLPGRAWFDARPIVLKDFDGSCFRRTGAAREAGFSCAIAVPVFAGAVLTGVLVLFCGAAAAGPADEGSVELWRHQARVSSDMTLVDGYFAGRTARGFESLTRDASLPRGSGLPGMAWQKGRTVLIDDLAQSSRFLRAGSAAEAGVQVGLAVPCITPGDDAYVLALLASPETPIAQRVECWAPDESRHGLQRSFGVCTTDGALRGSDGGTVLAGAIGKAYASGVPVLNEAAATEPGGVGEAALSAGLDALLALPVMGDGEVSEVVAFYF